MFILLTPVTMIRSIKWKNLLFSCGTILLKWIAISTDELVWAREIICILWIHKTTFKNIVMIVFIQEGAGDWERMTWPRSLLNPILRCLSTDFPFAHLVLLPKALFISNHQPALEFASSIFLSVGFVLLCTLCLIRVFTFIDLVHLYSALKLPRMAYKIKIHNYNLKITFSLDNWASWEERPSDSWASNKPVVGLLQDNCKRIRMTLP